jgi:phosphopantetheinyl transferase
MHVYWLEQTIRDVPASNDWLSPGEIRHLKTIRFPKRYQDWRLGRWTVKAALRMYLLSLQQHCALEEIEIRTAPSGAPEAFVRNERFAAAISISHRNGVGFCAVAPSALMLGCDLEYIESHSVNFVADYFTQQEQACIRQVDPQSRMETVVLLWSAKESVLKALHKGLTVDTRSVQVDVGQPEIGDPGTWRPLYALFEQQRFSGWWQRENSSIRTIVTSGAGEHPTMLLATYG